MLLGGEIRGDPGAPPRHAGRARLVPAVLGVLACVVAMLLVVGRGDRVVAPSVWVLGWLLLIGAAAPWRRTSWSAWATAARSHWPEFLLVAVIVAVAAAYRLPNLETLPGNIHNDEASVGLQARADISPGAPPLLSIGWTELPQLGYLYAGLFLKVFGDNLWALRFSSVVAGLASIVVLYLLARELFSRRVAVLAATLMAVAHVHVHWSRMGIHCIHAVLMVTLVLWLSVRAVRSNHAIYYVLAGLALACDRLAGDKTETCWWRPIMSGWAETVDRRGPATSTAPSTNRTKPATLRPGFGGSGESGVFIVSSRVVGSARDRGMAGALAHPSGGLCRR